MSVDHLPEAPSAVEDRLPPGRMDGHPLAQIREYRVDPPGYLWNRYFHHGRVFKALIGVPTVFMVGPDANRFILRDHADLFSVGEAWSDYLWFMIGEDALSMKDGDDYY